jgi:hypothetical protein
MRAYVRSSRCADNRGEVAKRLKAAPSLVFLLHPELSLAVTFILEGPQGASGIVAGVDP